MSLFVSSFTGAVPSAQGPLHERARLVLTPVLAPQTALSQIAAATGNRHNALGLEREHSH